MNDENILHSYRFLPFCINLISTSSELASINERYLPPENLSAFAYLDHPGSVHQER